MFSVSSLRLGPVVNTSARYRPRRVFDLAAARFISEYCSTDSSAPPVSLTPR